MTGSDTPLPPANSRRELRERERAAEVTPLLPAPQSARAEALVVPAATQTQDTARRRTPHRSFGSRLLSFAAILAVGAFVVGVSLPSNALNVYALSPESDSAMLAAATQVEGQVLDVEETADDVAVGERDGFEVKSWAQVLRDKYSKGNRSYSVLWTGPIRWPFPYEVPITDGFGPRAAPCAGCSTYHYALDLVPGAGTPIYAIADGVVLEHEDGRGSWGNYVRIQHTINGRTVISSYAHMQTGSSPLQVGDKIGVGDFVGLVGATGQVTAPHLHIEIEDNGVREDPYVWLTTNTAR
ncbi:MAG: hypothetical protein DI534_06790 [Leifsonia xyli]|nr:MAG: hypothetical protein DI534_06790 [Leifsonia xyli]